MIITDETIKYVSALAKLELTEEEKEKAKKDLGSIISYMEIINELDTDQVEPLSHVFPVKNVFRDDVVVNGPDRENILSNAPETKDGCFKVPKTVE
ncbi:Asp-tRNA(Asn)/Glu-tRNA(Gln) amidotransferase subunit GatC [Anaerobium acetethylicum]|uniref:Aspartyl/glutamyl-tRNA(Asn/Gln) amidotransferase subunit C n=1 Tax=Anaerobium acetethylicum TaxID=1619234 RepID=A0A1D3TVW2_9FIRM|nr:Asp-tRNA(Asn)/Glu-tRNA(Gln) amidotransferase subunit GatC [Anaerobium acetethylicum]SCP98295.1 aspartyl-tRNA(Asn)/glutamyl-tRNA(Gln) amidotransferase subunit C [Anaerobium acetethylicum]